MAKAMTKNYYFRKFKCGLTKEDTAKLCFKSVRTVMRWDAGQPIPPECRRLMKMYKGIELVNIDSKWDGWMFKNGYLINERGLIITPEQVLTGQALIEIGSREDLKVKASILKTARILKKFL